MEKPTIESLCKGRAGNLLDYLAKYLVSEVILKEVASQELNTQRAAEDRHRLRLG